MTIGRARDEELLSKKPSQIRNRLRRAAKRAAKTGDSKDFKTELALYQQETGFKPVEDWDVEELAHGKPRNASGDFKGPIPKWISPEVSREAKRRLYSHAFGRLGSGVDLAIITVMKLIRSEEVDDKGKPIVDARTKLDASKFIIEHVIGKAPQTIEVDATDSARKILASAIVLDDGRVDSHLVLEGEVVDDEEIDDDLGD